MGQAINSAQVVKNLCEAAGNGLLSRADIHKVYLALDDAIGTFDEELSIWMPAELASDSYSNAMRLVDAQPGIHAGDRALSHFESMRADHECCGVFA